MSLTDRQKEKVLKYMLRGYTERVIADRMAIKKDEVVDALEEIKRNIEKFTDHDVTRYFINETFAAYNEWERTLWKEFNAAMAGSKERTAIVKLISTLRKDNLGLRKTLGQFRERPKKEIPLEKIQELPSKIRTIIAKTIVTHFEGLTELQEPEPPEDMVIEGKIIELPSLTSPIPQDEEEDPDSTHKSRPQSE